MKHMHQKDFEVPDLEDQHGMFRKNLFLNLRDPKTNYKKRILELDIEKSFDKINHEKLMILIHLPRQINTPLRSGSTADVLKVRVGTDEGKPQGVIIFLFIT